MTRKKRYLTITVLGILIASNLFNEVVPGIGEWCHFESESENFTFGAVPSKGRDVEMMERRYEYFLHSKGLEVKKYTKLYILNCISFGNGMRL